MATVTFDQTTQHYPGSDRPAVDRLDLEIADGEFLVLVGPSGCGKSTSLRMLAGLEDVTEGAISIGDRDVTDMPPKDRDIAMVFQNYALYPHMSVADNMGFALKISGMSKSETRSRVEAAARVLDLTDYLDRKPKALSGGQRQRVAMGRAIVRRPRVFLMDEPLSNLDAKLRVQTRTQIAALQRRLGVTTLYVTHDQVEAMTMGDRVAVMKSGVLQQVGTARELYDRPANSFVAGFIGSPAMNLLSADLVDDHAVVGDLRVPLTRQVTRKVTGDILFGIRPEALRVTSAASGLSIEVDVVEEIGADAYVYGRALRDGVAPPLEDQAAPLVVRVDGRAAPRAGSTLHLAADPDQVHVFDAASGLRLG
ncbi:sn-glycerol-3-phosphate ABC transporter ATP-binding protein UgpC [Rhodococcus sp. BP-316]|uniref:ABC transporter ATP-binding protein n=1 Tax=Rhodococcus sp. BP-316 TaxID=2739445 RepID=UPI001C9A5056|nr:sn-glycerol-3-phosphate ABC transporter ATP-binding protein UgpC [Rhodococcus sp. BP-316]MBY6682398.1 sn-glycerol-3-phosphate ABC transporter ATP-binding protein UgpC [Rhodococcus sp. BP-316]